MRPTKKQKILQGNETRGLIEIVISAYPSNAAHPSALKGQKSTVLNICQGLSPEILSQLREGLWRGSKLVKKRMEQARGHSPLNRSISSAHGIWASLSPTTGGTPSLLPMFPGHHQHPTDTHEGQLSLLLKTHSISLRSGARNTLLCSLGKTFGFFSVKVSLLRMTKIDPDPSDFWPLEPKSTHIQYFRPIDALELSSWRPWERREWTQTLDAEEMSSWPPPQVPTVWPGEGLTCQKDSFFLPKWNHYEPFSLEHLEIVRHYMKSWT